MSVAKHLWTWPDNGLEPMEQSLPKPITAESLVREHSRAVMSLCLAHAATVPDADDAAQETFAKAIANLASLRDSAKARSWLFGIARRVCADQGRQRRHIQPLVSELPEVIQPINHRVEQLRASIQRLVADHREVITLYYLDGQSTVELAANLGLTPAAARQRLVRARMALHELMREEHP
jgi:RNA polymerase sigma-70 factor (ECF subfamily)